MVELADFSSSIFTFCGQTERFDLEKLSKFQLIPLISSFFAVELSQSIVSHALIKSRKTEIKCSLLSSAGEHSWVNFRSVSVLDLFLKKPN